MNEFFLMKHVGKIQYTSISSRQTHYIFTIFVATLQYLRKRTHWSWQGARNVTEHTMS